MNPTHLAAVAIGGAVGSLARYLVCHALGRVSTTFPWGVLLVNVVGCLAIGVLMRLYVLSLASEAMRLGVVVGVLGSLTTFSTFGYDTLQLIEAGRVSAAIGNLLLSVSLGLAAVWLGSALVDWSVPGV